MRTFEQLTSDEQQRAWEKCETELLQAITEGSIRFSDKRNGDDLQARIDAAWEKAEEMQTPWFAHEYIMDATGDQIRSMAHATAEDAMYSEPSDPAMIDGVILPD